MAKRRISDVTFDIKEAFSKALEYELLDKVYLTQDLKKFLQLKRQQHACDQRMFLPAMITATSNTMGMAKLKFTEDWEVCQNVFVLLVAPKGAGKTPASKVFLGPLLDLEREEIAEFDQEKRRLKSKRGARRKTGVDQNVQAEKTAEDNVDADGDANEEQMGEEDEEDGEDDDGEDDHGDEITAEEPSETASAEQFMFHRKTRLADQITPEALILSLHHGSGCLVIKADEFKGFFDKCVEKADNVSAICSAHSGEEVRNTTVKRGSISIYETRLNIFGAVQPGPLAEMVGSNKPDHQGHWDRYIFIPAGEDPDIDFEDQLKPIPDEDKMDIAGYLRCVRDHHTVPRMYSVSELAMEKFIECKRELKLIDQTSNFGNETSGMTKKAFPNLQKLAIIMACGRETLEFISTGQQTDEKNPRVQFKVEKIDVEAGWDLIQQSMLTYKSFKTSISIELGELEDPAVRVIPDLKDDIIMVGALKIKKIYEKADENRQILVSVVSRDKLYPRLPGITPEMFIEALVKNKIAKTGMRKSGNRVTAGILTLTTEIEVGDLQTMRLFKMLHEILLAKNEFFDPLSLFGDQEQDT